MPFRLEVAAARLVLAVLAGHRGGVGQIPLTQARCASMSVSSLRLQLHHAGVLYGYLWFKGCHRRWSQRPALVIGSGLYISTRAVRLARQLRRKGMTPDWISMPVIALRQGHFHAPDQLRRQIADPREAFMLASSLAPSSERLTAIAGRHLTNRRTQPSCRHDHTTFSVTESAAKRIAFRPPRS